MTRVLILGAGGAAANSVARCLGEYDTWGANCDPYDLAMADTDHADLLPRADDPGYAGALMDLIERIVPDVIVAQPEQEVERLAELGLSPLMPSTRTLAICADKFECAQRWHRAGVTVPRTFLISDRDTLATAMFLLRNDVWLRATHGAGGAGSLRCRDFNEAALWIDRHDGWGRFTAASVLSPETVCWQSVWYEGRLVVAQAKRRLRWANARNVPSGIGGSAAISETISTPEVTEIATRAILAVDPAPHGVFGVDMALDADGVPNPTEINAGRFFTTVDFFAAAGLNLPDIYCRLAADETERARLLASEPVVNPLRDGLLWLRGMDRAPVLTHRDEIGLPEPVTEAVAA